MIEFLKGSSEFKSKSRQIYKIFRYLHETLKILDKP